MACHVPTSDAQGRRFRPARPLKGGREIVEEGIGLGYLVIHVHKDGGIQRRSRQARVVWFTQREYDVSQLQTFRSLGELDEVIPRDVLGDDRAGGADERRETNRVVATARTNVADRRARLSFKTTTISAASFRASRCSSAERLLG